MTNIAIAKFFFSFISIEYDMMDVKPKKKFSLIKTMFTVTERETFNENALTIKWPTFYSQCGCGDQLLQHVYFLYVIRSHFMYVSKYSTRVCHTQPIWKEWEMDRRKKCRKIVSILFPVFHSLLLLPSLSILYWKMLWIQTVDTIAHSLCNRKCFLKAKTNPNTQWTIERIKLQNIKKKQKKTGKKWGWKKQ